jgi:hypothetical protein
MMTVSNLARQILVVARKTCGLALVLAASAGVAWAGGPPPLQGQSVPEINPGSAVTALGLLVGGVLMVTDRLRRK